jgi:molecular chaperone DnaJ
MARRDYYEILGVPRTAAQEEIKRAFRRLAREHHPDINQDPRSDERFKEINEAYQVLGDPERRAQYDRGGQLPFGGIDLGQPGPFGSAFDDIFDMFFGQPRPRGGGEPGPERGSDLRVDLEVSLEEVARGADKTLALKREETCSACFGTGAEKGSAPEECPTCRGAGQVRFSRRTPFGSFTQVTTCPQCHGTTKIIRRPCRECRGSGRTVVKKEITAHVPAGVEEGTRLRLQGEGEAGMRGGERGDLYVDVRIAPHPVFDRRGRDLHCEASISIAQAALGDEIEVPTLDGPAPLTVPPGIQPGSVLTLRDKGLPGARGGRGDLAVRVRVTVPESLTPEQAHLLLEFARLRGEQIKGGRKTLLGKIRNRLA